MYKICKTEQSASRQRQIEQYLLKIMHQRHIDDISVTDLCDGLQIPRKAFYRYFSGKQGALHALIDHTLIDMDAFALSQMHSITVTDNRRKAEMFFLFWMNQADFLDAIERCGLWEMLMDRTAKHMLGQLAEEQKPSRVASGEEDYLIRFAVYGIYAILQLLYRRDFPMSPKEAAAMSQFAFEELWASKR